MAAEVTGTPVEPELDTAQALPFLLPAVLAWCCPGVSARPCRWPVRSSTVV